MGLGERMGGQGFEKALRGLYGGGGTGEAKRRIGRLIEASGLGTRDGAILLSAPGRTELGGNHTDHNDGRVLAAAVRLDALAVCAPRKDGIAEIVSEGYPEKIRADLSSLEPRPEEAGTAAALVRGIARHLAGAGFAIGGFDARVHSLVPAGSGLSSSACVEILFGAAYSHLHNAGRVEWKALALAGRYAENEFFGKPCGLMDQMACAGGGVLAIDFRDRDEPEWKRVPDAAFRSRYELAIARTGGSHEGLTPLYAAIPAEMKAVAALMGRESMRGVSRGDLIASVGKIRLEAGDRAFQRALHFVEENSRVEAMVRALREGRFGRYLGLVRESGLSSRLLLQNVDDGLNPREQGLPLALALAAESLGKAGAARVHGGGFGGTIQAYVPKRMRENFVMTMESAFGPGCVSFPGIRPAGVLRLA
jgi:galactokinase